MKNRVMIISVFAAISIFCSPLFANHQDGLTQCYNYKKDAISESYFNCINRNFTKVARDKQVRLFHCSNFNKPLITASFKKCVNRNFYVIANAGRIDLNECFDHSSEPGVSYAFEACINQNFRDIYYH